MYLDARGLVALWREALLARAVLSGLTRGYTRHPQLVRFRESPAPTQYIAAYLQVVFDEATRRGYRFDAQKIGPCDTCPPLAVTEGQLEWEWTHLRNKLALRAPAWLLELPPANPPVPHPLFHAVPGEVAAWEIRHK